MEASKSATHTKKYSFVSNLGVGSYVQLLYVAPYVRSFSSCSWAVGKQSCYGAHDYKLLVQQQPVAEDMVTFHFKYDESKETSPAGGFIFKAERKEDRISNMLECNRELDGFNEKIS